MFIDDVGKGLARFDADDVRALGASLGDVVEVRGDQRTVARISGIFPEYVGQKLVQIDGYTRANAGVQIGGTVTLRKATRQTANTIVLTPIDSENWWPDENEVGYIGKVLQGLAVIAGDKVNIPLFGGKDRFFSVDGTSPSGAVIINQHTKFKVNKPDYAEKADSRISYEDIGGLERELRSIREMVEIPLRYGELFDRLGIEAPKGLLLYGPPGTGKTLIARAIAAETKLHFIKINGPEIIQKYYGDSEARLREIFEEATRKAPSVIFIDEIDALAPKRAEVVGDVEKRVVAQLLALMDGTVPRGHVLVIGATNVPEMIDPALRRPGRFDREIGISAPHADGRRAILKIHSRRMPLDADVDLDQVAQITHGFVGADLEALCKEAGMAAVRRYLPVGALGNPDRLPVTPESMRISREDFLTALREVEPTATREFFNERSTLKLRDIGGLAQIKETLLSIVDWPLKYPELFASGKISSRGILLSGSFRHREDRHGEGSRRGDGHQLHSDQQLHPLFEVAGGIGEGAARDLQESQAIRSHHSLFRRDRRPRAQARRRNGIGSHRARGEPVLQRAGFAERSLPGDRDRSDQSAGAARPGPRAARPPRLRARISTLRMRRSGSRYSAFTRSGGRWAATWIWACSRT